MTGNLSDSAICWVPSQCLEQEELEVEGRKGKGEPVLMRWGLAPLSPGPSQRWSDWFRGRGIGWIWERFSFYKYYQNEYAKFRIPAWELLKVYPPGSSFPFLLSAWDWGSSSVRTAAFDALNRTTSSEKIWSISILCRNTRAIIFLLFISAAFTRDSEEVPLRTTPVLLSPLPSVQHWLSTWEALPGCQEAALSQGETAKSRAPQAILNQWPRQT